MKNKIGIFIIFSLSFLYVNAQSVKGVVVDKKGSPLPFANVVQLSKDSTYISGITTDDKVFFILSKVTDAAILRISYVGFQTLFLPISSIHKDTDLRKIVVEESIKVHCQKWLLQAQGRFSGRKMVLYLRRCRVRYYLSSPLLIICCPSFRVR